MSIPTALSFQAEPQGEDPQALMQRIKDAEAEGREAQV